MANYEHLRLPLYQDNIDRKKREVKGGGYTFPERRNKTDFSNKGIQSSNEIATSFSNIKTKFQNKLNPSLIYEIQVNQNVPTETFEKTLSSMGIQVLSIAEGKKGYWIVFNDREQFTDFQTKITDYAKEIGEVVPENAFIKEDIGLSLNDSQVIRNHLRQTNLLNPDYAVIKQNAKIHGPIDKVNISIPDNFTQYKKHIISVLKKFTPGNYDFFNAIEEIRDIQKDKKIGEGLNNKPLGKTPEFIDVEFWRMPDPDQNQGFIDELDNAYRDNADFRITDELITNSFVLIRAKLTKGIFDEIIELKEIARADRPAIPTFNPYELMRPDVSDHTINKPDENAAGILIVDSGIISNHPLLDCIGGE